MMQSVKLPKTRRITEPTARTNQSPGAMILNRTKIRIKNDTTIMISNLASREKLQVKLRYMRIRRHMKTRSIKSALVNNRKRSTINSLNWHRRMKRTQRIKMSRIMCHVKRSTRIKNPRWLSTWLRKLRRLSGGWRDRGWIKRGDMTLQMIHPPGELKDPLRWLLRWTTSTCWGTWAPLLVGGMPPTLLKSSGWCSGWGKREKGEEKP
jgi:hypothetical protein